MPNGDPEDVFFYLTLTHMTTSYNPILFKVNMQVSHTRKNPHN